MSVKAIAWALEQDIAPELKITLVVLANFANLDNECWPKRDSIARLASVSPRSVTRYTQQLQELGLLEAKRGELDNGARSVNRFRLLVERQLSLNPPGQIGTGVASPVGAGVETELCPGPRDKCGPTIEPSFELTVEPSKKAPAAPFVLPDWVPTDAWEAFKVMRRSIRAPLNDASSKLTVRDLARLRNQGHDVGAVLEQSVQRGWRGVFPIKGDNGSTSDRKRVLDEFVRSQEMQS